ncbi:hypothetical protein ATCC90586_006097 [Pythium insidiosum]|nr:hypothetical protein ATCC90586_006097 [Pythium insidiosum]
MLQGLPQPSKQHAPVGCRVDALPSSIEHRRGQFDRDIDVLLALDERVIDPRSEVGCHEPAVAVHAVRACLGPQSLDAFLDTPSAIGGWSQQSRIEQPTLSFRYSEAFADAPLTTELVDRVWQALSSSSSSTKIFGGGLASSDLQVINDDTVVLFRAVFHPSTKEILRSVELVCRVSRGWEQLILLQSLEGLNIQGASQWTGCVGQCAEDKLQLWRREVPVMIARFETMVLSADICNGKWFVNPGSITGAFSAATNDVTPSFILMAIQGPKVVAFVYELKAGENVVVSNRAWSGAFVTDGKAKVKITLARELVYEFELWVGKLGGRLEAQPELPTTRETQPLPERH